MSAPCVIGHGHRIFKRTHAAAARGVPHAGGYLPDEGLHLFTIVIAAPVDRGSLNF